MALDGSIFGRPGADQSQRDSIMRSAVLNAVPSPSEPSEVVENPTLQGYYRLYAACNEIMSKERDKIRVLELTRIKTFADTAIRDIEGQDASAGPPAQTPPAVAAAAAPMGAPQAGGLPGALPGMPPAFSGGAPAPPAMAAA